MREIHILASFVHGTLVALHTIGIIYNIRRKNRIDTAIHISAAIYSLRAVAHHIKKGEPERH